mmetsp:Transcript_22685/g.72678  ORF Transcript_22685/g.72678 Transcript_22685/m.72678 type:complete len:261 (-) Transcript_22685:528-1310(-)
MPPRVRARRPRARSACLAPGRRRSRAAARSRLPTRRLASRRESTRSQPTKPTSPLCCSVARTHPACPSTRTARPIYASSLRSWADRRRWMSAAAAALCLAPSPLLPAVRTRCPARSNCKPALPSSKAFAQSCASLSSACRRQPSSPRRRPKRPRHARTPHRTGWQPVPSNAWRGASTTTPHCAEPGPSCPSQCVRFYPHLSTNTPKKDRDLHKLTNRNCTFGHATSSSLARSAGTRQCRPGGAPRALWARSKCRSRWTAQ